MPHEHDENCNHDHDHGNQGDQSLTSVTLANQIIEIANNQVGSGMTVEDVASGLRHAAANFSAYAFFFEPSEQKDPNATVEDFVRFFEYYLQRHKPQASVAEGLTSTIAQAKKDF